MFGVNANKLVNEKVKERSSRWLKSEQAGPFIAIISFVESVFAPIIIDPFLIAAIFAFPKKWKRFIAISVIASVLGGVFGYALGALFFDTFGTKLIAVYNLESVFEQISVSLDANGFVFVLLGAFTPIPYKLVAIASGLLQINFVTFLVASIIGRILRLGLIGLAAHMVGPKALPLVRKYLYHIAAAVGVILVVYILWQVLV